MSALTVWKFNTPEGAELALVKLAKLQKERLIEVQDAATVSWQLGKKKPRTKQAVDLVGGGTLDGAFWGLLFGLIFFMPLIGMALGAAMGALNGSLADYGIDDNFIKSIQDQVSEGTSALFLLTGNVTLDKVEEAFKGETAELIRSNLTHEQESQLRENFSGHS
ncbi:MAG: hypothetical protein DCF20_02455 [Pseudanabaena sp.]|nr:MAG: hypothetical protein DCF20_02455 [Pseudanabaena sp.]